MNIIDTRGDRPISDVSGMTKEYMTMKYRHARGLQVAHEITDDEIKEYMKIAKRLKASAIILYNYGITIAVLN